MKDFLGKDFSTERLYTLMNRLIAAKIPFEVSEHFDTPHIEYPSKENCVCSVICHAGSFGHEMGLLEIMGLTDGGRDGDVEGYLTADEVFDRINKHYSEKGE